jgi:hypothetical protein
MTKKRFAIENRKAMLAAAGNTRVLEFINTLDEKVSSLERDTYYDVPELDDLLIEMNIQLNQMLRAFRRIAKRLGADRELSGGTVQAATVDGAA